MTNVLDDLIGNQVKATRGNKVLEGVLAGPVTAGPNKGKWRIEGPGGAPAIIEPSEWTITAVPECGSNSWDRPPRS